MVFFNPRRAALAAALVAASSVNAQDIGSILSNTTSSCRTGAASLLLSLGDCLAIGQLASAYTSSQSGSVVPQVNDYLSTFCGKTCSEQDLQNGRNTINSNCAEDIQNGNTVVLVLQGLLENYDGIKEAGCLKNGDTFCVSETLNNVQSSTGQDITVSWITSIASGNKTAIDSLAGLPDNVLCSTCNKGIYNAVKENNATATQPLESIVSNKCGSDFVQGGVPSNLTNSASNNTDNGAFAAAPVVALALSAGAAVMGTLVLAL